jgi:hypothetical protein
MAVLLPQAPNLLKMRINLIFRKFSRKWKSNLGMKQQPHLDSKPRLQ